MKQLIYTLQIFGGWLIVNVLNISVAVDLDICDVVIGSIQNVCWDNVENGDITIK